MKGQKFAPSLGTNSRKIVIPCKIPKFLQAGGLSPALSALFNVPLVRVCRRTGARGARAHLSQALGEELGWEESGQRCN